MVFRKAELKDKNFIFGSWLKSFRRSSDVHGVPNNIYFMNQHKTIEILLARANCLLICDPNDPEIIYGYLVSEVVEKVPVIHWLYVKHLYRGLGLAKRLMAQAGIDKNMPFCYTHNSSPAVQVAHKNPNIIFNPYLLRESIYGGPVQRTEERSDSAKQGNTSSNENNPKANEIIEGVK